MVWCGAVMLTMVTAACDDDPEEVFVGDMPQYQKAYITTGVSYPNGIVHVGTFAASKLEFSGTKLVLTSSDELDWNSSSVNTDIYFRTTYETKNPVSGTLKVRSDAEQFIADYNENNVESAEGADNTYQLLPESYYTITDAHATIEAGRKEAVIHVNVNTEGWDAGRYLLPLTFELDGNQSVSLSENQKEICLVYDIIREGSNYDGLRMLSRDEYEGSSYYGNSYDSEYFPIEDAFDENYETAYINGDPGGTLYVKFKQPVNLEHFIYVNQNLCTGWDGYVPEYGGYVYYSPDKIQLGYVYEGAADTFDDAEWSAEKSVTQSSSRSQWVDVNVTGDTQGRKVSALYIYFDPDGYYYGFADLYFAVSE